ncbi:MAG: hypothetical protein ACK55Z_13620, partial [bacterium]
MCGRHRTANGGCQNKPAIQWPRKVPVGGTVILEDDGLWNPYFGRTRLLAHPPQMLENKPAIIPAPQKCDRESAIAT